MSGKTSEHSGADFGSILLHPKTFCGSGPIADPGIEFAIEGMAHMPEKVVGDMAKRHVGRQTDEVLGRLMKEIIAALSSEELGRFLKGRALERLKRIKKA